MKGHVRERGRGNWYAVLSMRDPETGKRRVKFVSLPNCKGKREAQTKCADIISAMRGDTYIEPDKTTLGQFGGGSVTPKRKSRREPLGDIPRSSVITLSRH
jgi:hypothetical protein